MLLLVVLMLQGPFVTGAHLLVTRDQRGVHKAYVSYQYYQYYLGLSMPLAVLRVLKENPDNHLCLFHSLDCERSNMSCLFGCEVNLCDFTPGTDCHTHCPQTKTDRKGPPTCCEIDRTILHVYSANTVAGHESEQHALDPKHWLAKNSNILCPMCFTPCPSHNRTCLLWRCASRNAACFCFCLLRFSSGAHRWQKEH